MDDDRLRLVTRYFSNARPPDLPLLGCAAFLVGFVLVVLALVVGGGFGTVVLLSAGAGCGYLGWSGFQKYAANRMPTDGEMDTLLNNDLVSITHEAAADIGLSVSDLDEGGTLIVVAVDLAETGFPPLARIGDDRQLRAERYVVFVLFLSANAVTICTCKLDFCTGEKVFGAKETRRYENVGLEEDWTDLPKPLREMVQPVGENEFAAEISKERVAHVMPSGRVAPIRIGDYSDDRKSKNLKVAWPNDDAVQALHRRLHT